MARYVLDISYKGSNYSGWQIQPNATTIQGILDEKLSILLKKPTVSLGAGRTDAGVHAEQLHVQFDHDDPLHLAFQKSMNGLLPKAIAVNKVFQFSDPDYNVRFHATSRKYKYQITQRKSALWYDYAYYYRRPLDFTKLEEGANVIMEYEDFESFCKARSSNKTFLCTMMESYWVRENDMLVYYVKANRFLRGMVRAIVGTLIDYGSGRISLQELRQAIEAKDRREAGQAVTPRGLFLIEVNYPEGILLEVEQEK